MGVFERMWSVHPRTSGEQKLADGCHSDCVGSSPHERGTEACPPPGRFPTRFIPARAGNRTVHQRLFEFALGSSPHERGTADIDVSAVIDRRFIPARAGNRLLASYQ